MDKLRDYYELENIKPVHKIKKPPIRESSLARIKFDDANIKIYYDELQNVWKKDKIIIGANEKNNYGIFQVSDNF